MTWSVNSSYMKHGDASKGFSFSDELSDLEFNNDLFLFPGFCDVHVHFREPGFLYKETILTGTLAAAHGGYTHVCTMPNLEPVPDSLENLKRELDPIRRDAKIKVTPYGSITRGELGRELSKMEDMKHYVCAYSDDGKGVQDGGLMKSAMEKARSLGKMIVAHCEDSSLLPDPASEYRQIERDIELARETHCTYHVCHISCKESVRLIRQAKKDGIDVSCETAPHYLLLNDSMTEDDGRFRMNPPIRTRQDQEALLEGISDGTIEIIATDHAPHSMEEKAKGFKSSASGIVGLESAFACLYTKLVKENVISLEKLIDLMAYNPRKRFLLPMGDEFTLWNLDEMVTIDPHRFCSMGRSTPFEGWKVYGKNYLTVMDGKVIYKEKRNG